MANTYTQIYNHVIFAVEGRQNLITSQHNDEFQKYITGIVSVQKQKLIAINNMPDRVHRAGARRSKRWRARPRRAGRAGSAGSPRL